MAKAKKLPSGSWRCQVYSHTEETLLPDGTVKKRRIYKSFTCDDTSAKGKRKCEQMAAQWAVEKELCSPYDTYICINKSLGITEGRIWKTKAPKTTSSNRTTFLPKFLIDMLKEKDGRIVAMTPNQLTDRFCYLRDSLGMNYRFHDLRHYYASINHALGILDQYIMEMGGWKTDRTLKAVYRNTLKPEKDKFANISLAHFDAMQHDMQHETKKVP